MYSEFMKIICLNTWGARVGETFFDFVKKHSDADIFCFQEVGENAEEAFRTRYPMVKMNLLTDLKELLPDHNAFFRPTVLGIYGSALFIKKDIQVLEEGDVLIHKGYITPDISGHHDRNMQWATLEEGGKTFTIMNVHGLWNGQGKSDTSERIAQSKRMREFIDKIEGSKILCGDFNLEPDTESLRIAGEGMRDLIKEYGITSTRTSLYKKQIRFADYVFTSTDIEVKRFEVLPDEVSDHAALLLEI